METYKPCRLGSQLSQGIGEWKSSGRVFAVSAFLVRGDGIRPGFWTSSSVVAGARYHRNRLASLSWWRSSNRRRCPILSQKPLAGFNTWELGETDVRVWWERGNRTGSHRSQHRPDDRALSLLPVSLPKYSLYPRFVEGSVNAEEVGHTRSVAHLAGAGRPSRRVPADSPLTNGEFHHVPGARASPSLPPDPGSDRLTHL